MKKYALTVEQLQAELFELNQQKTDVISRTTQGIVLITNATTSLENLVTQNGFRSQADEIHFFRHTKPPVYCLEIAYKVILKIESFRSTNSRKDVKSLIKNKLDFIKSHYTDFPEFTFYFNNSTNDKDRIYFLRSNRVQTDLFPLFHNESYSTGYDILASYSLAYKYLLDYYENAAQNTQLEPIESPVQWSHSKVALVELLYALKEIGAFNRGNIDMNFLSKHIGKQLNIDIKDPYKILGEIRERKSERCRFLKQLIQILEQKLDESDQ